MQKGGRVLLMIDPLPMPNLTSTLVKYGIQLSEDLVYDPENRLAGGDALSPLVSLYNVGVPIVKDFQFNTIFPLSRSVEPISPAPPAITVAPFCRTGAGSWARYVSNEDAPRDTVDFEGTKARSGPISLAVAATLDLDYKVGEPAARKAAADDITTSRPSGCVWR